ncbi:MAG TPA: low affinity iron permease family protein [Roseomonas sp.]
MSRRVTHQRTPSMSFDKVAHAVAEQSGRPIAFISAAIIVLVWAVTGPIFAYSDTWQLVINTGTTIVTFLMVFLIQNSQNRDTRALQLKLDELIRVTTDAKNSFISLEDKTEKELDQLKTVLDDECGGTAATPAAAARHAA